MIKIVKDILKVFDDNELWNEGVELIGSWCFDLYQKHFNVEKYPLKTIDIDFLIPFPYRGRNKIALIDKLEDIGFRTGFNNDGSLYLRNAEIKIEFLSPEYGRGSRKAFYIKNLTLSTIPIRYLEILLENRVMVKEGNIEIAIPAPLNFSLHKLLIAQRRKNKDKKEKDIIQAIFTLESVNLKKFKDRFLELPKKSKNYIINSLETAKDFMPLKDSFIEKVIVTLHN